MFQHKNHIPDTIKTNWATEKFRSLFQKKKKKRKLGGKISAKPYCLTNTEMKSFKEAKYIINIILKYINVSHIAIT